MRRRSDDFASQARKIYRNGYNTAREYPGTIAALIIGIGITAALLWAARRAGGWGHLQDDAIERLRQGYDYAREGYDRIRNRQETVSD